MVQRFFLWLLFLSSFSAIAQEANELHETAKTFMRQRDYANAILVLNRAQQQQPNDIEIAKDLGLSYYFQKNFAKALEIYKPILDRDDVDDQCFQVTGDIYLAAGDLKECEKIYKKGIKKLPESGVLYHELGKLQWGQKDYNAIKSWEKGIEADPSFAGNYYEASNFYYLTKDKVWSILYGETYLNMDPYGSASQSVKNMLAESYKKLFAEEDVEKNNIDKSAFSNAFLQTINKQSNLTANGITTESLTMIRARFILDWFNEDYSLKHPFKLFELQRQLLQEGMFDAYNQWIFTAAQNLPAYQNWITTHTPEYNEFTRFQKGRIFKVPTGQYYHTTIK